MAAPRTQMAEDLIRSFAATLRSVQLYSKGHPIIAKNVSALSATIQLLQNTRRSVVIGMVYAGIDFGKAAAPDMDAIAETLAELKHIRVGRVAVEQRVDADMGDMATIRRMYTEAVSVAGSV